MDQNRNRFIPPIWMGKIINYEYWPIWLFYIPIAPYIFWKGIRAGSLAFFTNVNPSFLYSGALRYSKSEILDFIDQEFKPKTYVYSGEELRSLENLSINFPFIIKPDMGERGKGVMLCQNKDDLANYNFTPTSQYILQEYITLPNEAAIFYIRIPSKQNGTITSLTTKKYMEVTGDGYSTIRQLMGARLRTRIQIDRIHRNILDKVLDDGQSFRLEPIGNHNRGTEFINSNLMITTKLMEQFEKISSSIPNFYYGRYDIKYNTFEEMENGKNIKIVELNGINSEPVHIYDQSKGILYAYKEFYKHIDLMYIISEENLKRGFKRVSSKEFWKFIFYG